MIRRFAFAGIAAAALFATAADATPTIITDHINARSYNQSSPTSSYVDFLGADFNTKQVEIERTAGQISFTLVTKKSQYEQVNADLADIFFDTNNPALPGAWNFAVTLGKQGVAEGVYLIDSTADYKTSFDIWKTRSGTYGGAFCDAAITGACGNPATEYAAPTRLIDASQKVAGLAVDFDAAVGKNADGFYHHTLTVSGNEALLDTYFGNFDFFWGTADCGNDPIWGEITTSGPPPPAEVPEPGSLALLTLGLAGLGLLRRRRA